MEEEEEEEEYILKLIFKLSNQTTFNKKLVHFIQVNITNSILYYVTLIF